MKLFLFAALFVCWLKCEANQQTGCLFAKCPKSNQLCIDDGRFGTCIDRSRLQLAGDSKLQENLAKRNSYSSQTKVKNSRSTGDQINKGNDGNALLKRFVVYLVENGIDIRGLSEAEMHQVVRAFIYKLNKDKQAWPKRLLSTIEGARRILNRNGITLSDLNENDLTILSQVIAKAYLDQEGTRHWPADVGRPQQQEEKLLVSPSKVDTKASTRSNVKKSEGRIIYSDDSKAMGNKFLQVEKDTDEMRATTSLQNLSEEKIKEGDKKFGNLRVSGEKDDGTSKRKVAIEVSATTVQISTTTSSGLTSKKIDASMKYVIIPISIAVVLIVCAVFSIVLFYCIKSVKNTDDEEDDEGLKTPLQQEGKQPNDYEELCRQHYAHEQSKTQPQKEPLLTQHSSQQFGLNGSLKRSMFSPQHNRNSISSASSWNEEPVSHTLDISMAHAILTYMEDHLSKEDRLNEEWAALCDYKTDKVTFEVAERNWEKNRTEKALPYDHNRVMISSKDPTSDGYINASCIIDNDPRSPMYIAAQGPLSSTVNDFWQMIWEQGCVAIVMLTPLVEETESQCARYWPDEGACIYSTFEIHLVSEHIWCEDYLVRSLYVKNLVTGNTRTLTQFHFLSWPHDTVPPSANHLLEMRRKVSKCFRSSNKPVMVHCSDGVGRTGTYILLDLVITRMLKGGKEMDIAATLEHLRDQRHGLVCTKEQLQFALSSVADEVNAILKVLLAEETLRMP